MYFSTPYSNGEEFFRRCCANELETHANEKRKRALLDPKKIYYTRQNDPLQT